MVEYLPILMMIGLVALFAGGSFFASSLLTPYRPTSAKSAPYECGIVPETEPSTRFPVRFYLVALAFIVLDVEIVFLYPFTLVFRDLGFGGIVAIGVFLLVLLVPFAYLLSVGALEWGPRRKWSSVAGAPMQRLTVMQRLSEALAARDSRLTTDVGAGDGGTEPVPGKAA
ncbi:MAG: NADH-quinone oxidoreductase subunit A [Acidimicrobiia bacterium]|nr:NADH-quinone oxidoreductase subunit A [Acidimicrobiia bacterium]